MGKILGAIIGLSVGLAGGSWLAAGLGALVGMFLGHLRDQTHLVAEPLALDPSLDGAQPARPRPPHGPEEGFAEQARRELLTVAARLFVEVARADAEVNQAEVRATREFFERELFCESPHEQELLRVSLKSAIAGRPLLAEAARACVPVFSPSHRLLLLDGLFALALADGKLNVPERNTLEEVARHLQLSAQEHQSLAASHLGDGSPHFAVLGVDAAASDDEVKSAFRQLAAAYHPDKTAHLGTGAAEHAARRFREVREAYEEIRRLRKL